MLALNSFDDLEILRGKVAQVNSYCLLVDYSILDDIALLTNIGFDRLDYLLKHLTDDKFILNDNPNLSCHKLLGFDHIRLRY